MFEVTSKSNNYLHPLAFSLTSEITEVVKENKKGFKTIFEVS